MRRPTLPLQGRVTRGAAARLSVPRAARACATGDSSPSVNSTIKVLVMVSQMRLRPVALPEKRAPSNVVWAAKWFIMRARYQALTMPNNKKPTINAP